jgi:hypothetical protein
MIKDSIEELVIEVQELLARPIDTLEDLLDYRSKLEELKLRKRELLGMPLKKLLH